MAYSHRSTISNRRLNSLRSGKMPTREEMETAMVAFPSNPTAAAIEAHRLASERRDRECAARSQ